MSKDIFKKSSRFKQDVIEEQVLSSKLDYIYNRCNINFRRNNDTVTQKKGCDLIFTYNNKDYIADEKSAARYYLKDLKTFSLELEMCYAGKTYDGWFVSDKNITDVLIFNYIRAPKDNNNFKDKLTSIETIFVPKNKIKNFILSLGYDSVKDLTDIFYKQQGRENTISHNGINSYYFNHNFFHLSKSLKFEESPVNIIFSKDKLIELAVHHSKAFYPNDNSNLNPDIKVYKSCFIKNVKSA